MTARYYVALIGPNASVFSRRMRYRLNSRLNELSATLPDVVGYLSLSRLERRNVKVPLVAVYFGAVGTPNAGLIDAVARLLADSAVVVPVVSALTNFGHEIPEPLRPINGIEVGVGGQNLDAIVNLVLENLGLLRRTRRLFISYRRTDASSEALQLRHELDSNGYDVFLDTHSVPRGDDFQEVLWQRLADSDVVVLLDTPGFLSSRWTQKELAEAAAMTIGLIQVVWPGHAPLDYTDLCERIYLDGADLEAGGSGLTARALSRITVAVEKLRARSFAARHNNLVREFCDAAGRIGVPSAVQPERFISAELPSGKGIMAIPAVGVPDALRYHEATHLFARVNRKDDHEVFLIYDHRGLRPSWGAFLDWLDEFLPVKGVRITAVGDRLSKA
jgi:hypothetical protein